METTDTALGTPECAVNFPRWLDMGESAGYDALPGAYLAERQQGICQQKAADFGEESPEAVVELFFLTELERQRVEARGGSKDYLKSLLTLTLQRIPEGECQIAKLNCELYMAEIAKEESDRELAEAYLRAAIDTRVKRGGAKALLFQKLTKLESWLTEWGEVAKVAELQPWYVQNSHHLQSPYRPDLPLRCRDNKLEALLTKNNSDSWCFRKESVRASMNDGGTT